MKSFQCRSGVLFVVYGYTVKSKDSKLFSILSSDLTSNNKWFHRLFYREWVMKWFDVPKHLFSGCHREIDSRCKKIHI